MCCNRFVGEMVDFGQYVVVTTATMYQEHVLSFKHLDAPLDEGRFVFERFWQGTSKSFSHVVDLSCSKILWTVLCICLA